MSTAQIDSTFVQGLVRQYSGGHAWPYIGAVLPVVLFEVMALGPDRLLHLGTRHAKLLLDDGSVYKLRYFGHALTLHRMQGSSNGDAIAVFTNTTPQQEVWAALHPEGV